MIVSVSKTELGERIEKNYERLLAPYYQIEDIYQPFEADWPGDKEGRAILAFVSHYVINGRKNPCLDEFFKIYKEKANEHLFLGPVASDVIFEQQLSGHSWLLRGLCEYFEQFKKAETLEIIVSTVKNLYFPLRGKIDTYPVDREEKDEGWVGGNTTGIMDGWNLSSDIGCAFMSIDGLSHAYAVIKNVPEYEAVATDLKALLDEMIDRFADIDKRKLRAQTHCSLTAARGMMRMLALTGEKSYFEKALAIYDLYVNFGMTYTYQNLNWWGRPDSWTEPCAIVDSLMLALQLYKYTKQESFRVMAARIYHNGFATLQRENGGAGTETIVTDGQPILRADLYEAFFCCTMRLSEGLRYINENVDLLYATTEGKLKKDGVGRYFDGDILYAEILETEESKAYAEAPTELDGHKLVPIPKYYRIPDEIMKATRLQVLFND